MRFRGLVLVGVLATTGACGTPNEVVPSADVTSSTDRPTPSSEAAGTTGSRGATAATAASSTTATAAVDGSTSVGPPAAEPAPCIISGAPRSVPGTAVPAFEVDADEEPALEEPAIAPSPTTAPASVAEAPADPLELAWLAPVEPPCGLVLVEARRELVAPCGPTSDCDLTLPQATLRYDSDDPAVFRHVHLVQQFGDAHIGVGYDDPGEVRTLAGRQVTIHAVESGVTTAIWSERLGTMTATALSISIDELAGFIGSLAPYEPAAWPGDEVVVPEPVCVDDTTRYAPTALPDGWNRFVLDIAPNGACGVAPFLFMSLVISGTEAAPGTLVTFVIGPSGGALPVGDGNPIMVGEHPAALWTETDAVGREVTTVVFEIGDVMVDAHGDADVDTMIELASSVELVDVATWEQLHAEIQSSG